MKWVQLRSKSALIFSGRQQRFETKPGAGAGGGNNSFHFTDEVKQWFPNCQLWLPGELQESARGAMESLRKTHCSLQCKVLQPKKGPLSMVGQRRHKLLKFGNHWRIGMTAIWGRKKKSWNVNSFIYHPLFTDTSRLLKADQLTLFTQVMPLHLSQIITVSD